MHLFFLFDLKQLHEDETLNGDEREPRIDTKGKNPWIGVVPVEVEDVKSPGGSHESFAAAMVNKVG